MKKNLTAAVLLMLALLRMGAATWEGSAITGGAGEFPAEGLYAACNSFPRDSVIEVNNLENGKTVTVTIVSNVANPGVFIALSPKAAEALGIKPGSAVRVRAVSLAASEAEATLPAARAGISADPDFNPRVFFEREKAALAAAAAAESSRPAVASAAPAQTSPAASSVQPSAPAPAPVQPAAAAAPQTSASATPSAPAVAQPEQPAPSVASIKSESSQPAEVLARSSKLVPPEKTAPIPALTEPSAYQAPAAAVPAAPVVAVQPAAVPEKPDTASVEALQRPAGSAGPTALAALAEPKAPETPAPDVPESVLSRVPAPSAPPAVPLLGDAEPLVHESDRGRQDEALALEKPSPSSGAAGMEAAHLAEAELPGMPETVFVEKPSALAAAATAELAEAEAPESADAIGTLRPLAASAAEPMDVALAEPTAPKAPLQTGVVAIGGGKPTPGQQPMAEMAEPDVPVPDESLVAVKPTTTSTSVAANDEPGIKSPVEAGTAPTAIVTERPEPLSPSMAVAALEEPSPAAESPTGAFVAAKPAVQTSPETALAVPAVPSPTESITTGPSAPASEGEVTIALEPALPKPPEPAKETVPVMVPTSPSPPAASVATIKGTGGMAEPPTSLPIIQGLDKGAYYIQIGVYGSNDALIAASSGLRSSYPVAIERISTKRGDAAYRLYIGPIARDESGLALLKIRSMGYKDAFVRQGS
jgi:rare lipoprotein A (peptidoglycan hydrolase)